MNLQAHHFTQVPVLDCEDVTRHGALRTDEIPTTARILPTEMPS
jgi:transcriptional regulator of met regulon